MRTQRTRAGDGWRPLVSKIGVGVLTGLIVGVVGYLVWEAATLPYRVDTRGRL
jgi:hypothetical protein